jgi:hypothetical protein
MISKATARVLAPVFVAIVILSGATVAARVGANGSGEPTRADDAAQDSAPTSVEVIPHVESVMERGQALQFRAIVRRHGEPLSDAEVTWSVTPRVGTISATGLFVATTACLPWDGIGLVVATVDTGLPGRRPLSDGALVAIHHDPSCLPPVPTRPAQPSDR